MSSDASAGDQIGDLDDGLRDGKLVLVARAVEHDHDRRDEAPLDDVVELGPAELDQPSLSGFRV